MAKGRVSGGTGLNMVAKLDINEAKKNALEYIKTLNDINKAAKAVGVDAGTGTAKAFDVKPLTEYQAGLLKIKQEKADQDKADKQAALARIEALRSERLDKQDANALAKEQLILQKQIADQARKNQPFPSNTPSYQIPVKLGPGIADPTRQLMQDTIAAYRAGKISLQDYESEIVRLNKLLQAKNSTEQSSAQSTNSQTAATKSSTLSSKQHAQAVAEEKLKIAQSTAELKNNAREMLNAKGSIEQRKAALQRLITEYGRLSAADRDSAYGTRMASIIKGLRDQIQGLGDQTKNTGSSVAAFFDYLKSSILGTLGPIALLTAAWSALKSAFDHNVEISDTFVDVQRTAKLSGEEVDRLGTKLKAINTRTSLEGLLEIGFIGGRLGVAKEDLVGFITEVDKLSVVLKKEFPGGAEAVATSLGKIVSVYKITQKEGLSLEDALRKVGSAILELSHNGGAPVQFLQEFALGTAGIAQVVKLSLPTLLAYGSVLNKAGIVASTAATGVTRFLSDLSGKREKYFAIAQLADANLTIEKFTDLINTDAKSALELFFRGLKAGNPSTTEMGDRLKSLNLTAGKVKQTVIALSEATDTLFSSTNLINRAYDEGTSVNHNFELANNSLAASFDKIKNGIVNFFTSAENGRALASLLNSFTDNRTEAEKLAEAYTNNKHRIDDLEGALKPLVERYDKLTSSGNLTKAQQQELREVTAKIGDILPGVTTKFDQYGNSIAISRDRINELTKAQKELLVATNRQSINKAHDEFLEFQRQAAAQQKIVEQMAAAVGKTQGNKTMTNSDVRDANDRLIIIKGRADAAAKAVKDMGGELTAAEKKVRSYYEGVEKAKKPAKIEATILGTGTEADEIVPVRTVTMIKADIKELQAANKGLDIAGDDFKANIAKIKDLRKELKIALNGGVDPDIKKDENTAATIIKSRNSLQREIDKMIKKSYSTQVNADEAEVQSVTEKYDTLRQKAKEYYDDLNKKIPKNKQVGFGVTLSGINAAELNEKQAAINKGINDRLKAQVADQTKDFEKVEDYRQKYGEQKAKERFTKELNISDETYKKQFASAEAYAKKLEEAQTNILNKYGDPTGYTDAQKQELDIATNELIAFNDKQKALSATTYDNIFQQVQTYQDKVNAADKKYLVNKKAIQDKEVENGEAKTMKMIKLLDESYAAEVSSLSSDELMKSTDWTKLFGNLNELTITQIDKLVKTIESQFNNLKLKFNPIDLKSIQDKLQEAKDLLIKENPFGQVGASIKEVFSTSADGAAKSTEEIKREWNNLGKATAASFAFVSDAVNSCDLLKDALGEVGTQTLSSLAAITQAGIQVASTVSIASAASVAAAAAGKKAITSIEKASAILAIISAALQIIQAISNVFKSIFARHDKNIEKSINAHKQQVEQLGYAYNALERDIKNSVGKAIEDAQYKQIENLKAQQAELVKMRDEESQKKKADQGKIDDYNNQIASIPDKIKDIQSAINETLTATTSKSISDAIVSGFKNGKRTAADFADDFNGMMEDALLKALQTNYLDGAIAEFYKSFVDASKAGLTDAEVAKLKAEYNAILAKAADQVKEIDKITGGGKSVDANETLQGRVSAITADQADKLTGQFAGFRLTQLETNNILKTQGKTLGDFFNMAKDSFAISVKIEANTGRTATNTDRLENIESALVSMNKKMDNNSNYLQGTGR